MPPLHPLRLHPLAQPLPSAPRPFAAASVPHTHLFPRPLFPRISPKTGISRCLPIFFGRPRLSCSRPRRLPFRSPSRRMLPDAPCGRRESPHSRPSLLLPLPSPPESNEPAPHSRGIPPRFNLTPRPAVSGPAPRPFAASSVPHLLSAAPSLRPQSRSLQPPALEPPSVSPCSRPASAPAPRRPVRCPPAAGFPRRPQSLRFPRFSAIRSPSVLCACPEILCSRPRPPPSSSRVSRVSAEVDLSAQTARTASAFSAFPLCSRH